MSEWGVSKDWKGCPGRELAVGKDLVEGEGFEGLHLRKSSESCISTICEIGHPCLVDT